MVQQHGASSNLGHGLGARRNFNILTIVRELKVLDSFINYEVWLQQLGWGNLGHEWSQQYQYSNNCELFYWAPRS